VRLVLLAAPFALAACGGANPAQRAIAYVPDKLGIGLVESGLRVDFGRAREGAISAISRLEGTGPESEAPCGPVGAVTWPSGLTAYFQRGAFLGWSLPDGRSAGIGCSEI
jgi:hypothetical protein